MPSLGDVRMRTSRISGEERDEWTPAMIMEARAIDRGYSMSGGGAAKYQSLHERADKQSRLKPEDPTYTERPTIVSFFMMSDG